MTTFAQHLRIAAPSRVLSARSCIRPAPTNPARPTRVPTRVLPGRQQRLAIRAQSAAAAVPAGDSPKPSFVWPVRHMPRALHAYTCTTGCQAHPPICVHRHWRRAALCSALPCRHHHRGVVPARDLCLDHCRARAITTPCRCMGISLRHHCRCHQNTVIFRCILRIQQRRHLAHRRLLFLCQGTSQASAVMHHVSHPVGL